MFQHLNTRLGLGLGGAGGESIAFDLKALFTGANQTFSDAQVLDTVSEGVNAGSLTVVDTSTGTVKIVSNELEVIGSTSYSTTGLYGNEAISRTLGKAIFSKSKTYLNSVRSIYGLHTVKGLASGINAGVRRENTLIGIMRAAAATFVATLAHNTEYHVLTLLGGYNVSREPFKTGDTPANFLYGSRLLIKGGAFTEWTLLATEEWYNSATLYVNITCYDPNKTTFADVLIPTNVLDVDVMFQPVFMDLFTGDNDDQLVSAHTPDVVGGATGTGNPWESGGTTWTIQSNGANNDPGATNIYTSDFSVDEDSFVGSQTTVAGNIDGIGGEDDTLRCTVNGVLANHSTYKGGSTAGKIYRLRYDYYIPSTNSHLDGIQARGNENIHSVSEVADTWTSIDAYYSATATGIYWYVTDGGTAYYQDPGADDVAYLKNVIRDEVTLNELFVSDDLSLTEGIFDVDVTIPADTDGVAGLVLCLDDKDSPANFIQVYYNRGAGKVQVWKCVAGTYTNLINATASYVAGRQLRAILVYDSGADEVTLRFYYNGAFIGTEQTITDAAIAGNTRHGIMSASSNNSLDNFAVHNRTNAAWDTEIASATGDIY